MIRRHHISHKYSKNTACVGMLLSGILFVNIFQSFQVRVFVVLCFKFRSHKIFHIDTAIKNGRNFYFDRLFGIYYFFHLHAAGFRM